ncbi:MAG: 50S ribosomal protein L11 methyltransferase [Acidimicrobiia bacterium]
MLGLVVTVPASEAELASDALWALGVVAVEERDVGSGTEDHLVELWTSLGDDAEAIAREAEAFPKRWRWRLVEIDPSVANTWRSHAQPSWIERDLVVVPSWLPFEAAPGVTAIRIEPGSTFGLGDHPTTVLSLRALRKALFPGATVLDVGCGSGVLAVAACCLGAARADCIDISPASIWVTLDNARANGVEALVSVSTTPLSAIDGPYDIVAANILAPALVELADDLRRVLAPDGVLVISGILAERHEHVIAALAPLRVIAEEHREGWAAISLRW